MPTAQELLNQLCETCRDDVAAQFGPDPRPGPEIIAGDRIVTTCCFVRDEIHFINGGRLIFAPQEGRDGRKGDYCRRYFVVCRKLRIVGGNKPVGFNPCGADDPGSDYKNNNVITWQGRLNAATDGAPHAGPGATGDPDNDVNDWSSWGSNNGRDGGTGATGAQGQVGGAGADAPGQLTLVALEVEIVGPGSHLTLDWDGQAGGKGGRGQEGGQGGDGMGGREGGVESSWGSESCTRGAGDGGRGGNGGRGGDGGNGGKGGAAGAIFVLTTQANRIGSGAFVSGDISYVNDGGSGGDGGLVGAGGQRGAPGKKGPRNSPCDAGDAGEQGDPGPNGSNPGGVGAPGSGGALDLLTIEPHDCSNPIPLPVVVDSIVPSLLCRGFSTAADTDVTITGKNLAQVDGVTSSLAGVSTVIKPSSTDTQLDLRIDVAGNSALGAGSLDFVRAFGPALSMPGAVTVQRFEVLSVAPASGARGASVSVIISGTCFDPAAAVQSVNVSGAGISVLNVLTLDSTTIQAVFEIGAAAPLGARNVTVSVGPSVLEQKTHSLINGFSVTA